MKRISVFSPYRISFLGGGTDISLFSDTYGGCVINTTIDRGIRLDYVNDGQPLELSSRDFLKSWSLSKQPYNSFLEAITLFLRERGMEKGRLSISGGVPPGTGIGSSSALVLGLLKIINALNRSESSHEDLAEEAFNLEQEFFGISLGRQDPYAIAFGGMKYMEFLANDFRIEKFEYGSSFIKLLEKSTLILYTGSSRSSSEALEDQVKRMEEGSEEVVSRLKEIKTITIEGRDALRSNDFEKFIRLVNYGWELKKGLGNRVTNSKVDGIIKTALDNGAKAARLMGGGSEGFLLLIADYGKLWDLQKTMMEYSDFVTRVSFSYDGPVVSVF